MEANTKVLILLGRIAPILAPLFETGAVGPPLVANWGQGVVCFSPAQALFLERWEFVTSRMVNSGGNLARRSGTEMLVVADKPPGGLSW